MPAGFVLAKIEISLKFSQTKALSARQNYITYMERILKYIHASAAYRQGIFGQGILVAVLDTGIYPHTDLQGELPDFGIISDSVRSLMMITDMERISAES